MMVWSDSRRGLVAVRRVVACALAIVVACLVACDAGGTANNASVPNDLPNDGASNLPNNDTNDPGTDVIRIATGDWPPYYSPDLEHGGLALRILREAFRVVGYDVEYTFLPWRRAYEEAKAGQYDGTAGWGLRPDRVAHFHYSRSIFQTRWVFFHRVDHPFDWADYADLADQRVGATQEYSYSEGFYGAHESGAFGVDWVPSDDLNYRKLLADRIDVFPQDHVVGRFDLVRLFGQQEADKVTFHPKPLGTSGNHLLMLRDDPRSRELLDAFDRGLAELQDAGLVADWLAEMPAPIAD